MAKSHNLEALQRCVELAREAVEAGDDAFGSVLLDANGSIIQEHRNRTVTGENGDFKPDATLHPELTLTRWAQLNLTPEERAVSTVYTSGEHCPMCAAAHAYVGLGPIVYISSTAQYVQWMEEAGVKGSPVSPLSINQVAPNIITEGPIVGLDEDVKKLHLQLWNRNIVQ